MHRNAFAYFLVLAILLCLYLNSLPAQADDKPTQQHQFIYSTNYVPMKRNHRVGGQPIVQVKINGTETAAFLLDTGATFSILSHEIAKRLNLKLEPSILDNGKPFFWKGRQSSSAQFATLKIANYTIHSNFSFRLLDDQNFMLYPSASSDEPHYDGIVGVNLLQHFAVLLDAPQHRLGLCVPGNLSMQQIAQVGLAQPYVVPITKRKNGQWFVVAQLTNNGTTENEELELDTGSTFTEVSDTTAQNLHLKILEGDRTTNMYTNNAMMGASSVDTLKIGNLTLLGSAVEVSPVSERQPPLLGMNILSGYRVLMDFPGGKMYLQPNIAAIPTITIGPAPVTTAPPAR